MKLSAVGTLIFAAVLSVVSEAKELPVEAFASPPTIDLLKLSPDGTKLSMIQRLGNDKEELVLVKLFDLQSGKQQFLLKADSRDLTIYSLQWANDKQLLMKASYASHRRGTPVTETRLMVIDIESGKNRSVISGTLQRKLVRTPQFQSNVVALMPEQPDNILLALDGFTFGPATSLVNISLNGGLAEVVAYGREHFVDWVTDRQHRPRIVLLRDDTTIAIQLRPLDNANYRTLWQFEVFSEDAVWPIGFDANPDILYVSAYHEGRLAIFKADISQQSPTLELVKADDNYDVQSSVEYSWQDNKVIAIGGEYVAPEYQAFQRALDAALPDAENQIISTSADKNRYIVFTSSATNAGDYLLGDRAAKSMDYLLPRFSQLPPEVMVAKQKISYQARDGLTIEGFLSLPLGYKEGTVPTVIFPHGGPISFDDGDFDYWTQFFANRGYAVLQMNFRGSSGYGFDFKQMGLQGWGAQMQDDVEDGTRWLIKKGIADPGRICIVGASYGGYAALMGAVKTPELYQCVVSFAGVTDVEELVKSYRRFTNYEVVKKQIGDDFDLLEQRSPLTHADKIQVPVLLVHGTKDRSVPVKQSIAMYKALKRKDKNVEYIELEDGDHYLSTNSHRLETFKAIDRFLKQHLNVTPQQVSVQQTTE